MPRFALLPAAALLAGLALPGGPAAARDSCEGNMGHGGLTVRSRPEGQNVRLEYSARFFNQDGRGRTVVVNLEQWSPNNFGPTTPARPVAELKPREQKEAVVFTDVIPAYARSQMLRPDQYDTLIRYRCDYR